MKKQVLEFCKLANITEDQFYGKDTVGECLYLNGLKSIPDGFNPTVGECLYLNGLESIPDGFNPIVGGSLYLGCLASIPKGFNPIVGGYLDLNGLKSIPDGFNPTVGECLYLNGLESIPDGFNPIVGGSLYLGGLTSIPKGFNPAVGESLYLGGLTSIPKGFNPIVAGCLYLKNVTIIPDGFNPIVGGYLDLRSVTSIPEGFNPIVGGSLYLNGLESIPKGFNPIVGEYLNWKNNAKLVNSPLKDIESKLQWQNGRYISRDGILSEVISNRGNVYRVRKIAKKEIEYLITDGNGNWSHGSTLQESREDLIYKITDRNKSDYEHLTPKDILSHEESIVCYRTITGACRNGTRHFIKDILNGDSKENYTIAEIIELTEGQFGNSKFKQFFAKL